MRQALHWKARRSRGHVAVAVGLSALMEGFGQAYNRQPAKAAGFLALGLGLSTASGLNTWLARSILRRRGAIVGAERLRPGLLAIWAATFGLNLWDAYRTAAAEHERMAGPSASA